MGDLLSIAGGGGVNMPWYICILLYMRLIWCNGFPEIWCSGVVDLWSIGGGSVVNLPWVYVHSAIYETYLV